MEVFGIGPLEIALIALIAFIVLGPDRIPGTMRQLGQWVRQVREMANNVTRDYNTEIREITGEITALQEEIRSIQRDLGSIATGIVTTPVPPAGQSAARSSTTAPANAIGPDRAGAPRTIVQSLSDDVKRAAAPPPAAAPTTDPDAGDSYEI